MGGVGEICHLYVSVKHILTINIKNVKRRTSLENTVKLSSFAITALSLAKQSELLFS